MHKSSWGGSRGGRQLWVQIVFGLPREFKSLDGNMPPSDEMKARAEAHPWALAPSV